VNFTENKRHVRLEQGEAFFAVAQDATKPFYVDAGNATLRVIGTRFEVHRGSERVRIAVAEGMVSVEGTSAPLTVGQRIDVLANGAVTAIDSIAGNEIGAWREGRLIYENVSIDEIVADISRYRGDVTLRSADAGKLRVTAGLHIDQIDPFLNGLPAILPVQIIRDGASILIDERD
jgi:transmembrane sensor